MSQVRVGGRWCVAVISAGVLLLGSAATAMAHDELTGTTPEQGATVSEEVDEVRLEFSGAIADVGSAVEVTGPDGDVAQGEPEVDGSAVVQPLADDLAAGEYSVAWRVTSQDGHPISGEFGYTLVGQESPTSSPEPPSSEQSASEGSGAATAEPTDSDAEAQATGSDHAANTAAAPAQGDASENAGPPWWVWGVLALAVVTVGALAVVAVRRR
jgi:methionine-rich copper-binding protein CopC